MLLSIVIVICDKDYDLLGTLLEKISKAVGMPHEVIVMDNRERAKDIPLQYDGCRIISCGGNVYQFEARRRALFEVQGDYVWFLDGDDSVLPLDDEAFAAMQAGYGIITFSYNGIKKAPGKLGKQEGKLLTNANIIEFGVQLWNKWISRGIIEETRDEVPQGLKVVASEDKYYMLLFLSHADSLMSLGGSYYRYNTKRSFAGASKIKDADHYRHLLIGLEVIRPYIDKLKDDGAVMDDIDCCFYLNKIMSCAPQIRKECAKIVEDFFTRETIKESFVILFFQKSSEEEEEFREQMTALFPFLKEVQPIINANVEETLGLTTFLAPCSRKAP